MLINYKSDFDFVLEVRDEDGELLVLDSCDFGVVLTSGSGRYEAYRKGDEWVNLYLDEGRMHVVCDNHGLKCGRVMARVWVDSPNSMYPDGKKMTVQPVDTGIDLVPHAGETAGECSIDVSMPFVIITAYDLAVRAGFQGTRREYEQASLELVQTVEDARQTLDQSQQAAEMAAAAAEDASRQAGLVRGVIDEATTATNAAVRATEDARSVAQSARAAAVQAMAAAEAAERSAARLEALLETMGTVRMDVIYEDESTESFDLFADIRN